MKKLLIPFLACILAGVTIAQTTSTEAVRKVTATNLITEDLIIGTGRTVTINSGANFNWTSGGVFGGSPSAFMTAIGITAAAQTVLDDATVAAMVDTLGGATSIGTGGLMRGTNGIATTSFSFGAAGIKVSDDGDGAITFLGLGNGSDEDLTLNLDDTANTGVLTSSTGLNKLTFTSIDLEVPAEAYDATGWDGDNTTPTKNDVRDKFQSLGAGGIGQTVIATSTTSGSTATTIPLDDTIPQNTEGAEYITATITPASASSTLVIQFDSFCSGSAILSLSVALFQDSTANALTATVGTISAAAYMLPVRLSYTMTSGTTSATTFKIRYGPNTGTAYILRQSSGDVFSTANQSVLRITEILP